MKVSPPHARSRSAWAALATLTSIAGLTACGAILGIEAGTLEDGGDENDAAVLAPDARADARVDARKRKVDGGGAERDAGDARFTQPDTGSGADTAALVDAHDGGSLQDAQHLEAGETGSGPLDATTLPDSAYAGGVVFVSQSGNDTATCGTEASPCLTVQNGITRAAALSFANVFVAEGTYNESLALIGVGGITVRGGLTTAWEAVDGPEANQVVVIEATTSSQTVTATNLTSPVTLSTMTIRSKASVDPGESLYGVFVANNPASATLELDDVVVIVANAGNGAAGTPGAPGTGQPAMCGASANNGATGATGPETAGAFSASGYVPGGGAPGASGNPGAAGSTGTSTCQTCGSCGGLCGFQPATSGANQKSCGVAGTGGCGGNGGGGGGGGAGGGSSIGVYAWNAGVVAKAGSITAGNAEPSRRPRPRPSAVHRFPPEPRAQRQKLPPRNRDSIHACQAVSLSDSSRALARRSSPRR